MKTQKKSYTFNSLLKQYTIFYVIYSLIKNYAYYDINVVSIIFYILLAIKIVVEFIKIINE